MSHLVSVLCVISSSIALAALPAVGATPNVQTNHLLYLAAPAIRDDLAYGGHGVLVFDIDNSHRFVKLRLNGIVFG